MGNGMLCEKRNWCHGLTGLLSLVILAETIFAGMLAVLYRKNDAIVEMRVELKYIREDIQEIKTKMERTL